jgi:hypothetical protein
MGGNTKKLIHLDIIPYLIFLVFKEKNYGDI